jgi:calcineurin-like phosphoesterase family protein
MAALVQPLMTGPVDLIGDIHGELDALERLLALLGYAQDGSHPQDRRLVFLGDLVDRGPDSLGVLKLVQELMAAGRAQCVLGNHELNLLLGKRREGNQWFAGETQELRGGGLIPQTLATEQDRLSILAFIAELPLALCSAELRVVHACWDDRSIAKLKLSQNSPEACFAEWRDRIDLELKREGIAQDGLQADLRRQNQNPVGVATSGLERSTQQPFWAGGRERRVERVAWWQDYRSSVPVVFGHYWRGLDAAAPLRTAGPYLFAGAALHEPLGPRQNAYCIDFSVGQRNAERAKERAFGLHTALAALRLPEYELILDRGDSWLMKPSSNQTAL